jgi:pimeloyl-ACP methyl ester carboxylesterase
MTGACWAGVQRLLDPRIRSYAYDRAGYGHSPESKAPRSAVNSATELLDTLQAADISPPYILVGHSYGGIIIREFLAAAGADAIAGMVFVDANQENTHPQLCIPFPTIQALCGGREFFDVIGLLHESALTQEEFGRIGIDGGLPTTARTSEKEGDLLLESSAALGEKRQLDACPLGMRPVTVIRGDARRDLERLLMAAQESDSGSQEHLEEMNEFLTDRLDIFDRDLQVQQLRLSGNSRFVQATSSGHAVMITEPDLIASEILAIWEASL